MAHQHHILTSPLSAPLAHTSGTCWQGGGGVDTHNSDVAVTIFKLVSVASTLLHVHADSQLPGC